MCLSTGPLSQNNKTEFISIESEKRRVSGVWWYCAPRSEPSSHDWRTFVRNKLSEVSVTHTYDSANKKKKKTTIEIFIIVQSSRSLFSQYYTTKVLHRAGDADLAVISVTLVRRRGAGREDRFNEQIVTAAYYRYYYSYVVFVSPRHHDDRTPVANPVPRNVRELFVVIELYTTGATVCNMDIGTVLTRSIERYNNRNTKVFRFAVGVWASALGF